VPVEDIDSGPILVRLDGDVHYVTLNRPDSLNAISEDMYVGLLRILPAVDRAPESKVMVVTGAGRGFCSGGDIKIAREKRARDRVTTVLDYERGRIKSPGLEMIHMLLSLEKPSIAMVNGPAAGLGANLALLMDIAVMADEAKIGDTHVKAGLVAGDGGAVIWPLLVGPNRAKEFLMTGRLLGGQEAERLGLVSKSVPRAELESEVKARAAELAALPVYAARATKVVINQSLMAATTLLLQTSLAYEQLSNKLPEREEAIVAFTEKSANGR
jgi:enoyl-CoA hydratase